jgi:hypothetical protein
MAYDLPGRRTRWTRLGLAALLALLSGGALGWHSRGEPLALAGEPAAALVLEQPGQFSTLAANAPAAAAIGNPSPTCTLPVPNTATCYIKWYDLSATAPSSEYMISMTVTIEDQMRAYVSGFFQSSMSLPADMLGLGFRVACGAPGAAGDPQLGASYRYLIQARATGGPVSQNGGGVVCPADLARVWLPAVARH